MNITQRKFFMKRVLTCRENGLHCLAKGLTGHHELFVPYEEILIVKIIRQSQKNRTLLLVTGFFLILLAINILIIAFGENNYDSREGTVVLCLFSLASLCIYNISGSNEVLIPTTGSGNIIMFSDKPNIVTVDSFLNELKLSIKKYLVFKYGEIDKDLPIEPQLNNLIWLQERDIITKAEFQVIKSKLLTFKPTSESIGFKNSN